MNMSDMQRTDSTQAMKSILSAYGDDEAMEEIKSNIDDISGSEDEGGGGHRTHPRSAEPDKRLAEVETGSKEGTPKKAKMERKSNVPQLVSYGDVDVDGEAEEQDISSEEEEDEADDDVQMEDNTASPAQLPFSESNAGSHDDDVQLPPEPVGKCSNKLQEKIKVLYEKMRRDGLDMNSNIQRRKDFRNPSIYEKLIEFCDIDEKGTNYPPEIYNPSIWGKDSMYDELAKTQKVEMERREREKKERTKVEFVTGTKKQSDGLVVEQKRKSKWDAQPPAVTAKPTVVTTTSLIPPAVSVTTSASGTKTTVISAVGTIKKAK